MRPLPDYGEHMKLDDWIDACRRGYFVNDDGTGNYATETEMSDETALPLEAYLGLANSAWSHVIWFNR